MKSASAPVADLAAIIEEGERAWPKRGAITPRPRAVSASDEEGRGEGVNRATVLAAIKESQRFQQRARELLHINGNAEISSYQYPRESGACRRASMDLTRALADMRRP